MARTHSEEVDVIIAGGGPAGCVVAGRLAYADPSLKIMLIEAGANNRDDPSIYRPGVWVKNLKRDGINDKVMFYTDSKESEQLRGRRSVVPCANVLGGNSSIDFQTYTRASASDWDDFQTDGWQTGELVKYMKRCENFQNPAINDVHGYDGPVAVSNGGQLTTLARDFMSGCQAVGIPFKDDLQDLNTGHGAQIWAKFIDRNTGRRSDAASAYVHSVMDNQNNLYLRTDSKVSRVIFEGNKAVGVAYVPSRNHAHSEEVDEIIVKARKGVVLCAGTLGTPQILERSGVGNSKILKDLDIKVISDLPGVGEQFKDHYTTLSIYRVSNETQTADELLRGVHEVKRELFSEWEINPGKARLASNGIDAGFKMRPTDEELKEMGSEFNEVWNRNFKDKHDKPVMFGAIMSGAYADHTTLPPGKYMTILQSLQYPASRGRVHICSTNPYEQPCLETGTMTNRADFAPIRWAYKKTREIARRMNAFRGELTSHHPRFSPASHAATKDLDLRTAKEIFPDGLTVGLPMGNWKRESKPFDPSKKLDNIKYSKEDDEDIDNWIADHVETTWHSLGTCAMKPKDKGGVVDPRLNVYGTENLKVIDLSICPENLGSNTYSTSLVIGEKGVELLAEDMGIKLKLPHPRSPYERA